MLGREITLSRKRAASIPYPVIPWIANPKVQNNSIPHEVTTDLNPVLMRVGERA
jgi:hypothetical protein